MQVCIAGKGQHMVVILELETVQQNAEENLLVKALADSVELQMQKVGLTKEQVILSANITENAYQNFLLGKSYSTRLEITRIIGVVEFTPKEKRRALGRLNVCLPSKRKRKYL